MIKQQIIDRIQRLNPTAQAGFLDSFEEEELLAYLHQLQELERDRRRNPDRKPVLVGE